jgi:hydroxyethylthiazole kinase
MKSQKIYIDVFELLDTVKTKKPLIHHLTNWVTIYDCAAVVKTLGASPVMAHAQEEVAHMTRLASALVLNIGTLTMDMVEAMKCACRSAHKKGIPIIFDACGAGATTLRDEVSQEFLSEVKIDIVKGNASEIARLSGEDIITQGVDSTDVKKDMVIASRSIAKKYGCCVVVTGKEDIVVDEHKGYLVKNGTLLMSAVVGTGCMAASIIGTFAAIEKDFVVAATAGLVCFEVAAECAAQLSAGPGTFKVKLYDALFTLDKATIDERQKIEKIRLKK